MGTAWRRSSSQQLRWRRAGLLQGATTASIRELLAPFEQTARLCRYLPPLCCTHGTHQLTTQIVSTLRTTALRSSLCAITLIRTSQSIQTPKPKPGSGYQDRKSTAPCITDFFFPGVCFTWWRCCRADRQTTGTQFSAGLSGCRGGRLC